MRLYDFTLAPSPRRVRIFLREKGIAVPLIQVDMMSGSNRTREFFRKNPLGSLPVLELDDGTCISESVAICRYFEEMQPTPPLFGVDARERATIEMWNRRIELEIFAPVGHIWSHLSPVSEGRSSRIPEFGEIQKRAATERIAWLNSELASRAFVAGDRFSIADITTLCMIDFARSVNIGIEPDQVNLARWYGAISSRPSAAMDEVTPTASKRYEVVEYDPSWPAGFARERELIERATGKRVAAVEHIGSTAVPGLAAKPIIDVAVAMNDPSDADAVIVALAKIGYEQRDLINGRYFLRKDIDGIRRFNLHLVPAQGFRERGQRILRDFLRTHPEAAREYGDLKRELAAKLGHDHLGYTRAKTAFIQDLIDRACDERALPRRQVRDE